VIVEMELVRPISRLDLPDTLERCGAMNRSEGLVTGNGNSEAVLDGALACAREV